jgi:nucleotide-binding universal stress UspA family protein
VNEAELIVVGLDGSEHSRAALRWAMADAARRRARIEVVARLEAVGRGVCSRSSPKAGSR